MAANIRYAIKQIWRSPGFVLAVVLTLALAIGVNTAVFGMLNGFLLRPLPYREPERAGALTVHKEGINQRTSSAISEEDDSFDAAQWQSIRDNTTTLSLATRGGTNGANMRAGAASGGATRYVEAGRVSAGYFSVLGVPLLMGRELNEEEDRAGGPNGAILSYSLWIGSFNGDRSILGKSVELKGEPYTVVGVLASGASAPQRADIFTPLRILAAHGECDGGPNCGIVARLRPGVSWEAAQAQLHRIRFPYFAKIANQGHGRAWLYAQPLQHQFAGEMGGRVKVLSLAVGFILIIACANLAGLMLVRVSRRSREMATRLALGATRGAIVSQLWVESAVLAFLGGAIGLLLAVFINKALTNFLPPFMVPLGGFALDARVIGFAFGAALLTSVFFGIAPALIALKSELRSTMSLGGRTATAGASSARQHMIAAQVALSFVLLTGAGLLIRTLVHLATLPPGFDPNGVMTVKASLDSVRYHKPAVFAQLMADSVSNLQKIPGVTSAAAALSLPYERGLNFGLTALDGTHAGQRMGSSMAYVTPGFFETLRIPLLAGRFPSVSDTATSQPIAVINTSLARHLFNDPRPIGRHLMLAGTTLTIVGTVSDVAKSPGMDTGVPITTEPVLYLPAVQTPSSVVNVAHVWFQPSWIVRTLKPVANLTTSMEHALAKADANLPISGAYSMADLQARELQTQRVEVLLLSTLSAIALLLSAIGIYGTVAHAVVQGRREVGIRLALGSTPAKAMLEVGRTGFVAASSGLIAGALLSLLATRALASEIFGVSPYDPATLTAVAFGLGLIAIGASLLPTLRIHRIQLAETLMTE